MSDNTTAATDTNNVKRRRALTILAVIVVIAVLVTAVYWLVVGRYNEFTDDAYVAGNMVQVSPQIMGTVVSISADDTDRVAQGDTLIQLSTTDVDVALERAKADLGETVRQVHKLFIATRQYQAGVTMGEAGLRRAQEDLQRREGMDEPGVVSREDIEHARQNSLLATAGLELAKSQLDSNRALTANTSVAQHPQVLAAAAHLRDAYLAVRRTKIVSPVSGYVARRAVQVGQRVEPGAALMAIVPIDEVWIDANFKEVQLRHLRIGQSAKVIADIYGDNIEYHGKVVGLGLGTGSAFSLLPAQNATGNWIKVVQRVPVRIALDRDELNKHPLRIGLSMQVRVDTHDRNGAVLASTARTAPIYSTSVFAAEMHEADALIQQIIDANLVVDTPAATMSARNRAHNIVPRHRKHR